MENVTEKIRKLLAKASSNNEHEAAAALLKARELMAKYKIDEKSVQDAAPQEHKLNELDYEADTYSSLRNSWHLKLAHVIANNHCCGVYSRQKGYKTKTAYVGFVGLDDDPAVALELFSYAVQHISAQAKEYARYIRERGIYPAGELNKRAKAWEDSYADGFTKGLQAKYDEQMKQDASGSMALVLVKPIEVDNFIDGLRKTSFRPRNNGDNASASMAGYKAGYSFNPVKQIPQA